MATLAISWMTRDKRPSMTCDTIVVCRSAARSSMLLVDQSTKPSTAIIAVIMASSTGISATVDKCQRSIFDVAGCIRHRARELLPPTLAYRGFRTGYHTVAPGFYPESVVFLEQDFAILGEIGK